MKGMLIMSARNYQMYTKSENRYIIMRRGIKLSLTESINNIRSVISHLNNSSRNAEKYLSVLEGAISVKKPFNIIQVGANDGRHNDPIYDFVRSHRNSTNIILIEPLQTLIPHLKENYSFHPSVEIINKAVATDNNTSFIRLFRVKKKYWDYINVKYGKDWPDYRVPTGVTTSDKDRLIRWVSENVQSDVEPEEIIESFKSETIHPGSAIDQSEIVDEVQLLQVDTEGMDDEIVYTFLYNNIHPDIINIESKHLSEDREQRYDKNLRHHGYELYNYTFSEKLALRHKI